MAKSQVEKAVEKVEKFLVTRAAQAVPCSPRTLSYYATRGLVSFEVVDGMKIYTRESIEQARALHEKHRRRGC